MVLYRVVNTKRIKERFTYSTFILFFKIIKHIKKQYTPKISKNTQFSTSMVPGLQVIKLQHTFMTLRDIRVGKLACTRVCTVMGTEIHFKRINMNTQSPRQVATEIRTGTSSGCE
jgi:hypothetical protein